MDILSFMLGKQAGGSSTTVESLSVTENGTYTADQGKAYSPVEVTVPQTTVESLSVTANGTYTAPTGKAYSPVTVIITGPFILFPKSATTPTPAEVLANGVAIYSNNTSVLMSNNADVCCFHVGTTLYFASRSSNAIVYSLYGNGNLRESTVETLDSTTGLYWSTWSNMNVYDTVYNASSRDDGLSRLAMFI